MITKKMIESLNEQINKEIYSGYLYLSMGAYAASIGLNGAANWFSAQVGEELIHAKKIYDYVNKQGARVMLKAIDEPIKDFSSAKDLFEKTLEHEKKVTKLIANLVEFAKEQKDKEVESFLQWFVKEQVEEEESAAEILEKFNLAGEDKNELLKIDNQLAARVFAWPEN
ncbi:ferritin [Candidatus Omnitrophota bacterium]